MSNQAVPGRHRAEHTLPFKKSKHSTEQNTMAITNFKPLVTSATTTQSPDISTIMNGLRQGKYTIPDYQRDSEQWDIPKKSLFIESVINNLTIPPLIVYPQDDENGIEIRQIIDGQQRLTTIKEFIEGKFALANEEDVEYAENVGPLIHEKFYAQLSPQIRQQIDNYTINLVVLPKNLEFGLRIEIFRRINEGGVPLSAHDLRLATFGSSQRVWLIRLAGIFDTSREGAQRMVQASQLKYQMDYPWKKNAAWLDLWQGSVYASGQYPSEIFLYYLLAKDLANVDTLLRSSSLRQELKIKFDRTTASVLDLYCAQLQNEDQNPSALQALGTLADQKKWFDEFELWFNEIKERYVPGLPVSAARKLALFIAAAIDIFGTPSNVKDEQWELIQIFLTKGPAKIKEAIGVEYPRLSGRWEGQRKHIEKARMVCEEIKKK